jgi:hypothetical protein
MPNITHPTLLWIKGLLFLFLGLCASVLLLLQAYSWQAALLHGLAVWAFCRFYYFAFYVIEHYADPNYRFAGLIDFARYAFTRRDKRHAAPTNSDG